MMWGREVYRTLNDAGLLVRESISPGYRRAGVVETEPEYWNLHAVWDGMTPVNNRITQTIDNDIKEWVYDIYKSTNLRLMNHTFNRRFQKAWPNSKRQTAKRNFTMLTSFGLLQGITVTLKPAVLVEL